MYKKIHCIGIGGIGISALARYYMNGGAMVSGSDASDSDLIHDLQSEGMTIHIGNDAAYVPHDVDLVIYSIAIDKESNEEYIKATTLALKPKLLSYPEALGELTREKKTIAICGTHGKTTTTALTYYALKEAGIEATMIVGSLIDHNGKKTNYVYGDSEYFIIEACEYRRSFLNYNPTYIIVTNIDADHLDYYKDLNDIQSAFREFASKLPEGGKVICHESELTPLSKAYSNSIQYTVGEGEGVVVDRIMNADLIINHQDIKLKVIGEHNQKNAQLVVALGKVLGLDQKKVMYGLKNFLGTWRRMEYRGYAPNGALVYDDYAHHPKEIEATLAALRKHYNTTPLPKIVVVFQPHLHSRTAMFYDEFIRALSIADIIYVLPIYRARSEDDYGMSNLKMVASLIDYARKNNLDREAYTLDFNNAKNELARYDKNHVIITMGAGKNNMIADELVKDN